MANNLDVLLKILLDKSARSETEAGISAISKKVEELDTKTVAANEDAAKSWDSLGDDFGKFTTQFAERYKIVNQKLTDMQTGVKVTAQGLREFSKIDVNVPKGGVLDPQKISREVAEVAALDTEIAKIAKTARVAEEQIRQLPDEFYDAAKNATELLDRSRALEDSSKKIRAQWSQISATASRGSQIFRGIFVAGAGTLGALYASAAKYAKEANDNILTATEESKRWQKNTELIQANFQRIGAVALRELLPYLEQAANYAGKIADYIEANPEIVKAAVGFGSAAAVIGGIGTVTFKAIQAFAGVGYTVSTLQHIAAQRMEKAAKDQLAAAVLMEKGATTSAAGGIGAGVKAAGSALTGGSAVGGSTIGFAAGIAGFVAFGVAVAALVNQLANHVSVVTGLSDKIEAAQKKAFDQAEAQGKRTYPGVNRFAREAIEADRAAEKAADSVGKLNSELGGIQGTGISQDVLDAYVNFRERSKQLENDAMKARLDVIKSYKSAMVTAEQANRKAVDKINSDYSKTVSSIHSDYVQANAKAERELANRRAEIARSAAQDIQRIEEDLQEKLKKLMLDHEDRMVELTQARDALGLVREQRRFERERDETKADANKEVARRKQELQQQLADLRRQAEIERAERQQQMMERLAEAAAEHAEKLKQQAEAYQEEQKQLLEQKQQRLRAVDEQLREELAHNREAFIARIRDLDAALLGEQKLRQAYYSAMLRDAQQFFQSYRSALGGGATVAARNQTTTSIPQHQTGGYTRLGLAQMHANEFVATQSTTRVLEQAVGGRLTQQNLQALAQSGGGGTTVQISYPGGLITHKELTDILKNDKADFLRVINRAIGTA